MLGRGNILNKNKKIRFLSLKILLKSSEVLYLQHKCQTDARELFWNVWVINEEYWKKFIFSDNWRRFVQNLYRSGFGLYQSCSNRWWRRQYFWRWLERANLIPQISCNFSQVQFSLPIGVWSVNSRKMRKSSLLPESLNNNLASTHFTEP